jgi:condensin-2 complex subunit H2
LDEYLQELAGLHPQQLKNLAERGARGSSANGNNNLLEVGTDNNNNNNNNNDVPNFAHAALILQNSSNVYSRKVEYLYSLVYKALDEFFNASKMALSSSSSNKNGGNRKSKTVDADVDEFFDFDPNEYFMLLDDVVPEDLSLTHRKINLKEDIDDDDNGINGIGGIGRDRSSGVSSSGGGANNRNNVTRLSLGGLSVTRLERSTVGGTLSSTSSKSVQQQRALLGILNNGSLRLMAGHCDVGDDGILLMPGSQSSRPSIGGCDTDDCLMMTTNGGGLLLGDGNNNEQLPGDGIDGGPRSLFGTDNHHFDNDDDHDNDGQGFEMNDDYDNDNDNENENDNDGGMMKSGAMDIEEIQTNVFINKDGGTAALASSSSTKRVAFAESSIHEDDVERKHQKKKKIDPWALLDPHSMGDSSYKLKPLKKGKTYRLPDGILQPPSECVTGASTTKCNISQPDRRSLFAPPTLRPSLAVESYRIAMGKQFEDVVSYRGLAYGDEFLYIAKENAKIRTAKRREERKLHQQNQQQKPHGDSNNKSSNNNGPNYDNDNYDDDDDNGGGFDFGGGGDDDHYDDDDDHDGDNNNNQNTGNAGLNSLDDAFRRRIDYDDDGNGEGM